MDAPRPARPSCPVAARVTVSVLLLALGGCEVISGIGDPDPAPAAEAPKAAETPAGVDPAAEGGVLVAAQEAEAERVRKAAEAVRLEQEAKKAEAVKAEQAARAEAETRAQARPVVLSDVAVKAAGGMFGRSGTIEVTAKATLNQALGSSTYVHVKSRCTQGDQLIADVAYLNANYAKPLEKYAVGEQADVKGMLYSGQGLKTAPSPCQFEFRVGGISGGLSIPVGEACWSGSEVAEGACDPPLVPVAMSGDSPPIEVHDLQVERSGGLGGSKGLQLNTLLRINTAQDSSVRLTFKGACRVGDRTFVDMGQGTLSAGPFEYEAGETVARSASLYWSSAFELADAPNDCDLTTSLWKTKAGTFGEVEEVRLQDSCLKRGKLRVGRCDPSAGPSPAPVALAAGSVEVDDVRLELVEPPGAAGKFQLKIQADVTVRAPVEQNDGTTAKVSCKTGRDTRVESAYLFGPELYYLEAGETARMTANAFGSHALETKPKTCKVEFFGGPRFSSTGGDGVELGSFCLKKDKVRAGGRC